MHMLTVRQQQRRHWPGHQHSVCPGFPAAQQMLQLVQLSTGLRQLRHWLGPRSETQKISPQAGNPLPAGHARSRALADTRPRQGVSSAPQLVRGQRLQRATASGSREAGLLPAAWRLPEQTAPAGRLPATSSCRSRCRAQASRRAQEQLQRSVLVVGRGLQCRDGVHARETHVRQLRHLLVLGSRLRTVRKVLCRHPPGSVLARHQRR